MTITTIGPRALEIHGVTKSFKKRRQDPVRALRGIDLTIEKGEVVGILGPNGSGKSTLVRVISTAPDVAMAAQLRDGQFSVVEVDCRGDDGNPIEVLFVVEQRRRLPKLIQRIESTDPSAIYTITDVKVHRSSTASSLGVRRMFGGRK